MEPRPEQIVVIRALVAYLQTHPLASDSAEGIHRWWLESPPVSMTTLTWVLDWMRTHKVVEKVQAEDGHQRYRRCGSDAQWRRVVQQFESIGDLN